MVLFLSNADETDKRNQTNSARTHTNEMNRRTEKNVELNPNINVAMAVIIAIQTDHMRAGFVYG